MIRSLELENFKAFGNRCRIPFAPITLIFGQNSSGKSSILQALYLLKQTLESRDDNVVLLPRVENGIVDLGSFNELIFDHDLKRTLNIKVECDLETWTSGHTYSVSAFEFTFQRPTEESDISLKNIDLYHINMDKPVAKFEPIKPKSKDRQSGRPGKCTWITQSKEVWEPVYKTFSKTKVRKHIHKELRNILKETPKTVCIDNELCNFFSKEFSLSSFIKQISKYQREIPIRMSGFIIVDSNEDNISKIIPWPSDINYLDIPAKACLAGETLRVNLENLFPLGPFRRSPQRLYVFTGTSPQNVGYSGNLLPELLFRNEALLKETNEWLKRLELGYQIKVSSISSKMKDLFEIRLIDTRRDRNVEVSLSDVGYGVSQILPFIVQSLVGWGQIISIEQPEVHIHPRLQADLGDLLATTIKEPGNQFIIETHSEHLVLRIMRRIRETFTGKLPEGCTPIKPEDVSILYVEPDGSQSIVREMPLNDRGELVKAWPGGFFEEGLREVLP